MTPDPYLPTTIPAQQCVFLSQPQGNSDKTDRSNRQNPHQPVRQRRTPPRRIVVVVDGLAAIQYLLPFAVIRVLATGALRRRRRRVEDDLPDEIVAVDHGCSRRLAAARDGRGACVAVFRRAAVGCRADCARARAAAIYDCPPGLCGHARAWGCGLDCRLDRRVCYDLGRDSATAVVGGDGYWVDAALAGIALHVPSVLAGCGVEVIAPGATSASSVSGVLVNG